MYGILFHFDDSTIVTAIISSSSSSSSVVVSNSSSNNDDDDANTTTLSLGELVFHEAHSDWDGSKEDQDETAASDVVEIIEEEPTMMSPPT